MDEEKNIMTLTDENGTKVDYELLDIIKYNDSIYTVFYPTTEDDTEVVILRVEDTEDINKSAYIVEQNEFILNEVFKIFKEKYHNEIKFTDNNK